MRTLAIHAAAGAGLLMLVTTMAPVAAQTVERVPVGTVETVRTDCVGGQGTLVVRQTRIDADTTRVVVLGHDVRNGRWAGSFSPKASTTSRDVDIDLVAVDHEFRTAFEVDDVTGNTNTTLVQGFKRACAVGVTRRPRSTSINSATIALVARHRTPGELITAGAVIGCTNGSRWKYAASADYRSSGTGWGSNGLVCRDDMIRIPRTVGRSDVDQTAPDALSLVVRNGHGDVRRISYRSS